MPRARPTTEPNVIQKPELLRQLQRFLGLRQAHIAPALNEGVQPVVVLADLSGSSRVDPGGYASGEGQTQAGDGSTKRSMAVFDNPIGSGVKATVRWIKVQGISQGATPVNFNLGFTAGLVVPNGVDMLVSPDPFGGVFLDGDPHRYVEILNLNPFISSQWPRDQGRTKCNLYVGRSVGSIGTAGSTGQALDAGAIYRFSLTDQLADRHQEVTPVGLVVYPGQQLYLQAPSNAAANGTVEVHFQWLEEPAGGGEGNP